MTSNGWVLEPTHLSTWLRRDLRWLSFMSSHAALAFTCGQCTPALWGFQEYLWEQVSFIDIGYIASNAQHSTRLDAADVLSKRAVTGKNLNGLFRSRTLMFNHHCLGFRIECWISSVYRLRSVFQLINKNWNPFPLYVTRFLLQYEKTVSKQVDHFSS